MVRPVPANDNEKLYLESVQNYAERLLLEALEKTCAIQGNDKDTRMTVLNGFSNAFIDEYAKLCGTKATAEELYRVADIMAVRAHNE